MEVKLFFLLLVPLSALSIATGDVRHMGKAYWVDGGSGDDSNPGTQDKPFKTIIKARDTIRAMKKATGLPDGGVVVTIMPGDYSFIDGPLEFTSEDSGNKKSPIMYTSNADSGGAHLTAGMKFNWNEHIAPVQDPVMRALLKDEDNIVQIDLRKLGISDFGELQSGQLQDCANNKVELFSGLDQTYKMVLARYPNIDTNTGKWQWLSTGNVTDKTKSFKFNTNSTVANRVLSWKNTTTLWLHGYWTYDWADNYVKVDEVSTANSTFVISDNTPPQPFREFVPNARYYALNLLEELDAENEYYIDRGSGILYLFESAAKKLSDNQGCISVGEDVLVLENVTNMLFSTFTIDCARSSAVTANNVTNVTIDILSAHSIGGNAISVTGYNNTMVGIAVTNVGCGAIQFSGGNQMTLERGNNQLTNAVLSDWSNWKRTYTPGLSWEGVGNTYTGNSFTNAPHAGAIGGGNDCLFEGNVFDTLCYETSDAGAFYSGRSWIDRGNIVRGNTFKNIVNTEKTSLGYASVQAVYLDDQMSGFTVENNQYINCQCGTLLGGGRRNMIRNNTCTNCTLCHYVDARGLNWMKSWCVPGGAFEQQLKSVNYQQPPWSTHYPELLNIYNDHPCYPVHSVIESNKCCKSKQLVNVPDSNLKQWMVTFQNNIDNC